LFWQPRSSGIHSADAISKPALGCVDAASEPWGQLAELVPVAEDHVAQQEHRTRIVEHLNGGARIPTWRPMRI